MLEVMISKKKARRNSASKNKPKRNGKANEAASSWKYAPLTKTKIVKKLPKAPKKIRDKMERACERILKEIRKHRECDNYQLPAAHVQDDIQAHPMCWYYRRYTAVVWATFWKDGPTMMSTPIGVEDYDYQNLTEYGSQYLEKVAHDAAKAEKLRIGGRTYIIVEATEKGGCDIGYGYIASGNKKTDIIEVPVETA